MSVKKVTKRMRSELRLRGLKGGRARADALTPERRKEIARQGGLARAKSLTAAQRQEIASEAGQRRAKTLSAAERRKIASQGGIARWAESTPKPPATT